MSHRVIQCPHASEHLTPYQSVARIAGRRCPIRCAATYPIAIRKSFAYDEGVARTVIAYLPSRTELTPEYEPPTVPDVLESQPLPEGIEIVATVADGEIGDRGGLATALHRIAAGEADTLLVARLHVAADSLGALVRLLDWLDAAGASLLAADLGLDTRDASGQDAVALLREIERWGHEVHAGRAARGRPGLSAAAPALAQRIALLRERGLSLQAIAEALNEQGVPTPRGGARWRASSVQSALGYRRPRPPAPGAPAPPSRGPGRPPGSPRRYQPKPPPHADTAGAHHAKPPAHAHKPPAHADEPPPGRPAGRPPHLPKP